MKHLKWLVLLIGMVSLPFVGKNNAAAEKNKFAAKKIEEFRKRYAPQTIKEISDSICWSLGVPHELVREIGDNESNWRCIRSLSGGTDYGDLQVIDETFDYWYKRLNLKGGKTRKNYLLVGIHYLKYQHNRYGSWEKARYAYARGFWKNPSNWTDLEHKFMSKIDWSKYDS
ncbi:MAG: hypothetical protein H6606_07505 [Flavobacteriales bacterium]|nr:hypothetical protein [Flavobacteriales bacterium]